MRAVGGPLDGQDIASTAHVVEVAGFDGMAYVRTLPTDTDWRERYDHEWFIHGLPEAPPVPDRVYEWHPEGWLTPEVRMIREALRGR